MARPHKQGPGNGSINRHLAGAWPCPGTPMPLELKHGSRSQKIQQIFERLRLDGPLPNDQNFNLDAMEGLPGRENKVLD